MAGSDLFISFPFLVPLRYGSVVSVIFNACLLGNKTVLRMADCKIIWFRNHLPRISPPIYRVECRCYWSVVIVCLSLSLSCSRGCTPGWMKISGRNSNKFCPAFHPPNGPWTGPADGWSQRERATGTTRCRRRWCLPPSKRRSSRPPPNTGSRLDPPTLELWTRLTSRIHSCKRQSWTSIMKTWQRPIIPPPMKWKCTSRSSKIK